jgi:mercuric ion binding protein
MKRISKFFTLSALAFSSASSFAATTTKITVNGMVCAFCAQGIEKRLSKLPETKAVFVDLKQKTVAVEAKEGKTLDEKKLKAEITDAGYDVVKMEATSASVADITAEMGVKK